MSAPLADEGQGMQVNRGMLHVVCCSNAPQLTCTTSQHPTNFPTCALVVAGQYFLARVGEQLLLPGLPPPQPAPAGMQYKRCNCKKAKCLKLYCVCFGAGGCAAVLQTGTMLAGRAAPVRLSGAQAAGTNDSFECKHKVRNAAAVANPCSSM